MLAVPIPDEETFHNPDIVKLVHDQKGDVAINGVQLSKFSRNDISCLIGYVSQTPFLFSGTIVETRNIISGNSQGFG